MQVQGIESRFIDLNFKIIIFDVPFLAPPSAKPPAFAGYFHACSAFPEVMLDSVQLEKLRIE
jgi:hypothetical protein